jgi:hypothetical protein
VADGQCPSPERTWYLLRAPETLCCAPSPEKRLLSQPRQNRECHSNATQSKEVRGSIFEKRSQPGAPLRNRTVDLLLTMDLRPVLFPQAGRMTSQNTSTDQRPQAPDRPSRAPFATQSATHFDLVLVVSGEPPDPCGTRARHRPASGGRVGAGHGRYRRSAIQSLGTRRRSLLERCSARCGSELACPR